MAKNQNTYAKRRREMDKRQKADDKRKSRVVKKTEPPRTDRPSDQESNYYESSDSDQ